MPLQLQPQAFWFCHNTQASLWHRGKVFPATFQPAFLPCRQSKLRHWCPPFPLSLFWTEAHALRHDTEARAPKSSSDWLKYHYLVFCRQRQRKISSLFDIERSSPATKILSMCCPHTASFRRQRQRSSSPATKIVLCALGFRKEQIVSTTFVSKIGALCSHQQVPVHSLFDYLCCHATHF